MVSEMLRRCDILAKDRGFVNAVHNIHVDVRVENIVVIMDALKEFNTNYLIINTKLYSH